jgi:hypothetical protein
MDSKATLAISARFWPGLHALWHRGDFHSLLVSILFGWVVVLAWLATFIWTEWTQEFFSPTWLARTILVSTWVLLGIASLIAAAKSCIATASTQSKSIGERETNLKLAQEHYLQANYFEAEKLVRKNRIGDRLDIESTLLWISLLRRTRRIAQALELISATELLDSARPWSAELRSERELCLKIKIQTPPAHE